MRIIVHILCCFFFQICVTTATTHYVDATNGNDSNTGTSSASPWKTIQKVNSTTLMAGDSVLLKSGETWREEIVVPASGQAGRLIYYGSYGTGEKPRLLGSNKMTGFTQPQSNIWKVSLSSQPNWVWMLSTTGQVTWGNKKTSTTSLTSEYDWYWSSGVLYIYSPTDPSTRYSSIEASQRATGVRGDGGKSYIKVENLRISFTMVAGVKITGTNWVVNNNILEYSGINDTEAQGDGVWLTDSYNLISNNIIRESSSHGINIAPYNSIARGNIVEHNTIYNSYHNNLDIRTTANSSATGNIIRYNFLYLTDGFPRSDVSGIFHQGYSSSDTVGSTQIYYNIIKGQTAHGIQLSTNVQNIYIYNNTIYKTTGDNTACFYFYNSTGKVTLKNNIAIDAKTWSVRLESAANKYFDNNLYFQGSGYAQTIARIGSTNYTDWSSYMSAVAGEANSQWAKDPLLTNPDGNDFHLQSSSPAIDKGVNLGITKDYYGNSIVSSPDLGAASINKF